MVLLRLYQIEAEELGEAARELNGIYEQLANGAVGPDEMVDIAMTVQQQIEALADWLVQLHAEVAA